MKAIILLAGAAAFGISAPAAAQHHGDHDNGHHHGQMRGDHDNGHHHGEMRDRHDNGHHYGWSRGHRHERLARGERFRSGYGTYYSYNRIPWNVRHRYHLNSRYRYYYDNGYYYAVDPTTMVVEQVISALLR